MKGSGAIIRVYRRQQHLEEQVASLRLQQEREQAEQRRAEKKAAKRDRRRGNCSGMGEKVRRLEAQLGVERTQNKAREKSILETAERYRVQRDAAIAKLGDL